MFYEERIRKMFFKLIFALAMSVKVSPKKLAGMFDDKKTDDYAKKFHDELLLADQREQSKTEKAVKKVLKTKTQKK